MINMDFDSLIGNGGSFVADSSNMDHYRRWANEQSCKHCGKRAKDRVRNYAGQVISGFWLTENDCGCEWRLANPESPMTKEWLADQNLSKRFMTSERYQHPVSYWRASWMKAI